MERSDILHLASLSRLALTEEEIARFQKESDAILAYVDAIKDMAGTPRVPQVGLHQNPLRDDVVTNAPGSYTERLLAALPKRVGNHALVKRILSND
jgi:aspartyl/glutamyl-tRNA(Asn/Gln) amidotransferase C subunit